MGCRSSILRQYRFGGNRRRGRTTCGKARTGQLETFIGDAKISRKQSPADGHETLSEGVAWFDFH